MAARFCETCGKDGFRSFGGAMAAAGCYSTKRDVVLRVYYESRCNQYHLSSKVNVGDFPAVAS